MAVFQVWLLDVTPLQSLVHSTTRVFDHASVTNEVVLFPGCAVRRQVNDVCVLLNFSGLSGKRPTLS